MRAIMKTYTIAFVLIKLLFQVSHLEYGIFFGLAGNNVVIPQAHLTIILLLGK